jgi:hypothetical protein
MSPLSESVSRADHLIAASSWLAEAAASKLRAEALAEFLAGWEAEHDVLTAEEIARAERELGLAAGDTAA